mmetsp:Transcript_69587/g.163569  ORF Transcript_69587/g.163569 Transcript_69587/m.163569 type:complete len:215 (-) Transcript_69587:896-1540(-)
MGWLRRARHPAGCQPDRCRRGAALHHDRRGRGAAVCAHRHGRGPAAGALRALRVAAAGQPDAPQERQGQEQPGRPRLQGGPGGLRHARQIPLRGHQLPADRALPLLDQKRAHVGGGAATAVRRDRRGAGQGEGHRQRLFSQGEQQPRLHQGRGRGQQAHRVAGRGWQAGSHRGPAQPLGLCRRGQAGLSREHPDPLRGRREHPDARVQELHREP